MVDETCTLSVDESQLYPECVVTRAMAKKAERESHSDVTNVSIKYRSGAFCVSLSTGH